MVSKTAFSNTLSLTIAMNKVEKESYTFLRGLQDVARKKFQEFLDQYDIQSVLSIFR